MKTLKKILCTFLVIIMCLTAAPLDGFVGMEWPEINIGEWFSSRASAVEYTEGYYTYKIPITDDKAIITEVDKSISGDITIPATLGGYSVTTIGEDAFFNCYKLTSITIPDSVTTIGDWAFADCDSLTSVTIPDSVVAIGDYAFNDCREAKIIEVPNTVKDIGAGAFWGCTSLENINIPYGIQSIKYSTLNGCSSLKSITIPDTVTSIGSYAFSGCSKIESIVIPQGVRRLEEAVLAGCMNLTSVTIPDSVTSIGIAAFADCRSLTSIIIPDSVISIAGGAFGECRSLTSIVIPKNITRIEDELFIGCTNLKSVTLPDCVNSIGADAFKRCQSLKSITLPESVQSIHSGAFKDCTSLTDINIPYGVSSLVNCFWYCNSLTTIEIPNSVTNLEGAFISCPNLASIEIPSTVTNLEGAFQYCSSLTSIEIPNSVTKLNNTFSGCSNLVNVRIPSKVTGLLGTFSHCAFTSMIIPDNIVDIGFGSFFMCENLTNITIPVSVRSIRSGAFEDCINLTDVYYLGTEEEWNSISIEEGNEPLLNATIHFFGVPEPDSYKMMLCSDGAYSDSLAIGETISFRVSLLKNGKTVDCTRAYAISFDKQGVYEVVDTEIKKTFFYITLKAKKTGVTNMTVSDNVTGAYVKIDLKANYNKNVLTMEDVKNSASVHDGIITSFYNYNGLYVNRFNYYKDKKDIYKVIMDVYNEKSHYGAVVSYDENGEIYDFVLVEPKDQLPTEYWDAVFDFFDWVNYKINKFGDKKYTDSVITQCTSVSINVPEGGYVEISNNCYKNPFALFINITDIFIDVCFAVASIADTLGTDAKKTVIKLTLEEIIKEIGSNGLEKIFRNVIKGIAEGNIDLVMNDVLNEFDKLDIDFEQIIKDTINEKFLIDIGEDVALTLMGGVSAKLLLKTMGYVNSGIKIYDVVSSGGAPEISMYTPPTDEKVRKSNGVTVTSETPLDPDYVLHSYIINETEDVMTDAKPTIEALASNYTMYDITLYKSAQAVQPNARIKVMIPIPAGYNKNNIQVYWYQEDGTLTSMNATVEGDYAVFYTDHLSYYVLVEEEEIHRHSYEVASTVNPTCTEAGTITYTCSCSDSYTETIPSTGHSFAEGQSKCLNCDLDKADGCGCKCHKSGIAKIIFRIVLIFQKIFKKNKECTCGIYHY